jgi:hypothetical protein
LPVYFNQQITFPEYLRAGIMPLKINNLGQDQNGCWPDKKPIFLKIIKKITWTASRENPICDLLVTTSHLVGSHPRVLYII